MPKTKRIIRADELGNLHCVLIPAHYCIILVRMSSLHDDSSSGA
jgi:hypothetical protein